MSAHGEMMVEDRELEDLRRRRAEQIKAQAEAQEGAQEAREAEVEAAKAQVLRSILTPEARERLAALRMARPDLASSVENQLIALARSGRLGGEKLTDEVLKQILARFSSGKRDINIERR